MVRKPNFNEADLPPGYNSLWRYKGKLYTPEACLLVLQHAGEASPAAFDDPALFLEQHKGSGYASTPKEVDADECLGKKVIGTEMSYLGTNELREGIWLYRITTNNRARPIEVGIDEENDDYYHFTSYRGEELRLDDFTVLNRHTPEHKAGWTHTMGTSYFDALFLKVEEDMSGIVVGHGYW
jgi:hypothetical protein